MAGSEFTPRMQQIVIALLDESGPIPVKQLAGRIHISKRTVQRDLEYIPKVLKKYGITFRSKTGTGIWLEGSEVVKTSLRQEIEADDALDVYDRIERQKRLILEILKDKTLKKLYYYSDLFGVSEATVGADLEAVKGWFHKYHLEIKRRPGYGVFIAGSEKDFRAALRMFIDENINSGIVQEMYENRNQSVLNVIRNKNERNIYRLLDDDIIKRVTACILRIRDRRILNLTKDSYIGLVIHVAIAVNRIRKQEIIEENTIMTESLRNDQDYGLAMIITRSLAEEFGIQIPEIECAYICLHIKGSKIQQLDKVSPPQKQSADGKVSPPQKQSADGKVSPPQKQSADGKVSPPQKQSADGGVSPPQKRGADGGDEKSWSEIAESRELWDVVNEMIDCYAVREDDSFGYLLRQDEEFVIEGLIAHLKPTLVRLANGMKIQNPVLGQIKQDYPAIFERCKMVAKVIERRYGYEVPEPEIGFLAIHFGAAEVRLESRRESRRKVILGIVCASGIGISRLMSSKITRGFADRIELTAYGMADLTPYVLSKTDFFVSTMPLKEDAEILCVSPLLPNKDMERIARKIRQYEYMPKKQQEQEFTLQLDQVNFMAVQIKNVIRFMEYQRVDNGISFAELLIAISERLTTYADRQGVIQEDLLKRERLGSQIFPDYGFGLFHARSGGVFKPVFSVCQTKDGQAFTDPYFKGVCTIVIMMVPKGDHEVESSEILGVLSERLIEEKEFLEAVKYGEKEMVREFVSMYLNQYFKKFLNKI